MSDNSNKKNMMFASIRENMFFNIREYEACIWKLFVPWKWKFVFARNESWMSIIFFRSKKIDLLPKIGVNFKICFSENFAKNVIYIQHDVSIPQKHPVLYINVNYKVCKQQKWLFILRILNLYIISSWYIISIVS